MDARTHGRTHARTDGRTENFYSIFRDKLLLLGEHGFPLLPLDEINLNLTVSCSINPEDHSNLYYLLRVVQTTDFDPTHLDYN